MLVIARSNRNLALLYVFQVFKSLQIFGAVTVPFYLEWGGLDYTRMFVLESSYALFIFLLEVPTGAIADRLGRKWSLVVGSLLSGISFALFGLVRAYPLFFVANFFCAAGAACLSGADQALLYDSLLAAGQTERSRPILARYQAISSAAMLVGFPLGSSLADLGLLPRPQALAMVFVLTGGLFLLAALPVLAITEPPRAPAKGSTLRQGLDGLRTLLRPGHLRRFTLNYALISSSTFFIFWFYQSLAHAAQLPVRWNGFLGAGLNFVGMVLLWNAARLERIFGLRRLLVGTAALAGVGYLALGLLAGSTLALAFAFVIVGMKLLRGPLLSDLINQKVNSQNRATILSGVSMLERASIFVMYPMVGWAADRSLAFTFVGLGATTLLFTLLARPPQLAQAATHVASQA
jgi:MFS family permease